MEVPYVKEFEQALHGQHVSEKDIELYVYFNRKFLNFADKDPYEITKQDMLEFMLHLMEDYGSKKDTILVVIDALKRYYKDFRHIRIAGLEAKKHDLPDAGVFVDASLMGSFTGDF